MNVKVKYRYLDYYDLIEFPSGKHVPVPLAIKHIGIRNVLKIPIDEERKRDRKFYYCPLCKAEVCRHCRFSYNGSCIVEIEGYKCLAGYSFFRCNIHNPVSSDETKTKLHLLEVYAKTGCLHHLRYIEVDPRSLYRGYRGGIHVFQVGKYCFAVNDIDPLYAPLKSTVFKFRSIGYD